MAKQNKNELEIMRHSAAHVLAAAVEKLFPGVQLGIGPAIENGFYYDFDFPEGVKLSEGDLERIDKEMRKIVAKRHKFEKSSLPIDEVLKMIRKGGNQYKLELAEALAEDGEEELSFYKSGDFDDLCSGSHVDNTGDIGAFKLTSIAGAYWRGDEKNQMLTRIYGVSFPTAKELKGYLENLERLKKNDHRKLGKQLDLFCFSALVGPGLPLYTPKGTVLKEELQKHAEKVNRKYGFQKVMTPHIARRKLYELSGHAKKFPEELFCVKSERYDDFVLNPVLCPHQTQIYASRPRSYRDLPIRYMESDKQYRAEKQGELRGLSRVLAITVEDGHSFCRVDQVKEEAEIMVSIVKDFYSVLGLWGKHWVSLSVRDPSTPEQYIGSDADWEACEAMLEEVNKEMGLDAKRCEGEAALYGPKLDFMFKDTFGREIQIPTIQIDFATPKRFDLSYINEQGAKVPPVMVHRAILGSYERLIALLIEHFGGAFPLWLSPVHVKIVSVSEKAIGYAEALAKQYFEKDLRVEVDSRDETLSAKIRDAEMEKVPYIVVVGSKEEEKNEVSVRVRGMGDQGAIKFDVFVDRLTKEIQSKSIDLWS